MRSILKTIACYQCQHSWAYDPPLGRRDECPSCHRPCKVCLNCTFYDPQAYHECRESQAEWVKDKEEGNFCSYFSPKASHHKAHHALDQARLQLDALFGQKTDGGNPKESDAPDKALAKLFNESTPTGEEDKPASSSPRGLEDELKKFLKSK